MKRESWRLRFCEHHLQGSALDKLKAYQILLEDHRQKKHKRLIRFFIQPRFGPGLCSDWPVGFSRVPRATCAWI